VNQNIRSGRLFITTEVISSQRWAPGGLTAFRPRRFRRYQSRSHFVAIGLPSGFTSGRIRNPLIINRPIRPIRKATNCLYRKKVYPASAASAAATLVDMATNAQADDPKQLEATLVNISKSNSKSGAEDKARSKSGARRSTKKEQKVWIVDKILECRPVSGSYEYKVQWDGLPPEEAHLRGVMGALGKYEVTSALHFWFFPNPHFETP